MHKPVGPTHDLSIQSFEDALREALAPQAGYDVSRWLYVPNRYEEYRYVLGTRGTRPLICCGINPSTAAPEALDNTLQSVERIAKSGGFDSFLMFNVYPQRATVPDDMDTVRNEELHRENMRAFRYLLHIAGPSPTVWAAWGAIVEKRPYLADCIADMAAIAAEYGASFVHAGPLSKKGHPHHPLYLRRDTPLAAFPIAPYLALLEAGKKTPTRRSTRTAPMATAGTSAAEGD